MYVNYINFSSLILYFSLIIYADKNLTKDILPSEAILAINDCYSILFIKTKRQSIPPDKNFIYPRLINFFYHIPELEFLEYIIIEIAVFLHRLSNNS